MTKEHRSKNLAIIHILKNKLALSDDTYRAMLFANYAVSSSKDLHLSQQRELILLLNNQLQQESKSNAISEKQIHYILKLSKDHISNLLAYCSKILNRSITNLNYLSKQDGITIINSLQRYHRS
ncbi:MAG: phage protein GemA/Gp16 family protein [Brevinema sp.]